MPIDKDILIQEVAKRHHVLLNKDDPILVTVTLNELIIKSYLDQIELKLGETEQAQYEIQREAINIAKDVSEKIITNGAKYLHENYQTAGKDLIDRINAVKINSLENKPDFTQNFTDLKKTNQYLLWIAIAQFLIITIIAIQLIMK